MESRKAFREFVFVKWQREWGGKLDLSGVRSGRRRKTSWPQYVIFKNVIILHQFESRSWKRCCMKMWWMCYKSRSKKWRMIIFYLCCVNICLKPRISEVWYILITLCKFHPIKSRMIIFYLCWVNICIKSRISEVWYILITLCKFHSKKIKNDNILFVLCENLYQTKNKWSVIYFNYIVHVSSYKIKNGNILFVSCEYLYQTKNKWSVINFNYTSRMNIIW